MAELIPEMHKKQRHLNRGSDINIIAGIFIIFLIKQIH
jgi:hypothetical protein